MPDGSTLSQGVHRRILLVGEIGAGKTAQIWTLEGRKCIYILDPNAEATLSGMPNFHYEKFMPDAADLDAQLKGFNKGSKSDRPKKPKEPKVWLQWCDDLNTKVETGFFKDFDWLCIDSLTFLARACMDRNLYLNGRYGDVEDLADYRVVGSKIAEVFAAIVNLPINIFATGHLSTYQDELTKRVVTQLNLPGKARAILPLQFSDIWLARVAEGQKYEIVTRPEARGMKDLRCSIRSLAPVEDVTIPRFDASTAGSCGIGRLLKREAQQKGTTTNVHQREPGRSEGTINRTGGGISTAGRDSDARQVQKG